MQDQSYDEYDPDVEGVSTFARIRGAVSTIVGALVALALLMALGIWFYRLGVRDAQNVPIIRAATEPAKTRPEDPGGVVAPHQDMESYEAAGGEPIGQAAAAVIATQPPAPKPEDVPMALLEATQDAAAAPAADAEQTPVAAEVSEPLTAQPATEPSVAGPQEAQTLPAIETAPATAPTPAEPELEIALNTTAEQPVADEPAQELSSGTTFAPRQSPLVTPRPADLRARLAAAKEAQARNVDDLAARAAASKVQIQLAADPSEAAIRLRWNKIRKSNEDLLRDRALAIQTTVSGGTTFYRLRVGPFKDAAEARALCQALKGRGQDCIIARNS